MKDFWKLCQIGLWWVIVASLSVVIIDGGIETVGIILNAAHPMRIVSGIGFGFLCVAVVFVKVYFDSRQV